MAKLLHQRYVVHVHPVLNSLIAAEFPDVHKGHAYFFAGSGQSHERAFVGACPYPMGGNQVAVCQHMVEPDVKIGEPRKESLQDRLETLGPWLWHRHTAIDKVIANNVVDHS